MSKRKTPAWALDNVRFSSDAGDDLTCREYLCALLETLWNEQEGFSGKRPFGNSGWDADITYALAEAKCISGKPDDGWGIVPADADEAHRFVSQMIDALATSPEPTP